MPNYKMVDADVLDGAMLETAKAIREKGGTKELIAWNKSTGYKEAIDAITAGGGLNFTVVGGTTKPANPRENTIWVDTGTEIGKWTIAAKEPESATHGEVWIKMTSIGTIIEALTENSLLFAIEKAYQYKDGEWIEVDIQIYRGGEWESTSRNLVIYDEVWNIGYEFKTDAERMMISNDTFPASAESPSKNSRFDPVYVEIDVTGRTNLVVDYEISNAHWVYLTITTNTSWYDNQTGGCISYKHHYGVGGVERHVATLPINGTVGKVYFKVHGWSGSSDGCMFKLYSLYAE